MKIVKTKIRECSKSNIVSQYWEGNCPSCGDNVKVPTPPEFTDWKAAYDEMELRYEALKEYTYEYSKFLEKQIGYYPEDQYLKESLISMLDRIKNFHPHINFDRFEDPDNET